MRALTTRPCTDNPFLRGGGGIRPEGRAQAARRRVAHLAADGYTAAEITEVEGIKVEHVEALLGELRLRAEAEGERRAPGTAPDAPRGLPPHLRERHRRVMAKLRAFWDAAEQEAAPEAGGRPPKKAQAP